jgi:ferredoxin-NADP reductase
VTDSTFAWRKGRLAQSATLSSSARSLTFDVPGWSGNQPGQHVDVRLTAPDGYQAVRSYSLANSGAGESLELAVERLPDGEVSPFLVDELEVGDEVELRGPLGRWFVWQPEETRPVQLIGGGSGVVPLVAMIRAHADAGSFIPMQLLYSLRSPENALYQEELRSLSDTAATTWHYTRVAPEGWAGKPARLTAEVLRAKTLAPESDPIIYICGPTGFVESVAHELIRLGHDPEGIRTERFGGA